MLSEGLRTLYDKLIDAQAKIEMENAEANEYLDRAASAPAKRDGLFCSRLPHSARFRACLDTGLLRGSLLGLSAALAVVRGAYFLAKTHVITDSPRPVPQYNAPEQEIQAVKGRWQNFEHAVRERQPVEIELTADDINGLIAANRHARGKAFVSIEGNRLSLQTSLPLNKYLGQSRYYLSGDITIQSDAAASLAKPRLESVAVIASQCRTISWIGNTVPRSLRDYLAEYSPIPTSGRFKFVMAK